MKNTETPVLPNPPNPFASLMAGFDAITANMSLLLLPVALDLLLWLGPHLRMLELAKGFAAQMASFTDLQSPESAEILKASQDMWLVIGERFNIFSLLRSYPVGLPSLMTALRPVLVPDGSPAMLETPSAGGVILWLLVLTCAGLVFGSLYYKLVADAALRGRASWREAILRLPWTSGQVLLLGLTWILLAFGISLPTLCFVSALMMGGAMLGQIAIFLYAGLMLWLFFPLLFSPHGIFVKGQNVFASVWRGVRIMRMTLPTTALFFVMVFMISEGLEILWQIPPETSWMTLVGVLGHAFITTGLLAASFVYYREADHWVQAVAAQWKNQATTRTSS